MTGELPENRFLCRPYPRKDESLLGYLARLASKNGFEKTGWMITSAKCQKSFLFQRGRFGHLPYLLNKPESLLDCLCYQHDDTRSLYRFKNAVIRRSMINLSRPRVCPECLQGDSYRKQEWDLSLVACCPTHQLVLIDQCPSCKHKLSWKQSSISECYACGCKYTNAAREQANQTAISVTRYILSKTMETAHRNSSYKLLHSLNLPQTLYTLLLLGSYGTGNGLGAGNWISTRLAATEMYDLITSAGTILLEWPDSFYKLLDNIRQLHPKKSGLESDFGSFYETLFKSFSDPEFDFLRDAFSQYVQHHWNGGFLTQKNSRTAVYKSATYATKAEATRHLHVRQETIDKLARRKLIKAQTRAMGSRQLTLIDRRSLTSYASLGTHFLSLQQAIDLLGVSEKPLRALIDKGWILEIHTYSMNASRPIVYDRRQIQSFLSGLLAKSYKDNINTTPVSFEGASRRLSSIGYTIADIIDDILNGNLDIVMLDRQRTGIQQCCISEPQIETLLQKHPIAGPEEFSIPQAAKQLGIKEQVAYELTSKGILKYQNKKCRGRNVRIVSEKHLLEFRKYYVSAAVLARRDQTSPAKFVETSLKDGVLPITGPSIDGCRQYFYSRKQMEWREVN